jgi:hypothetical protein
VQGDISDKFKMPKEKVIVNMTFLGGGFGRKAFLDYTQEVVTISKRKGVPVQVVWTREDDIKQGLIVPVYLTGGRDAHRKWCYQALKFKMAGQNIDHWNGPARGKPNGSTYRRIFESILTIASKISALPMYLTKCPCLICGGDQYMPLLTVLPMRVS